MKKSNFLTKHSGLLGSAALALVTAFGITSCRPDYNLDTEFPEWLGTSIYETLQQGFEDENGNHMSFSYFVRLIEDRGQAPILAKTGTRTMFVADDESFERFFATNRIFKKSHAEGDYVRCYEDLSNAQKDMILNGSTLNNVYQVAMLSSSKSPDENQPPVMGNSMRKLSSSTIYDTIPIVYPAELPNGPEWRRFKTDPSKAGGIALMQNGTVKPMIFFVNDFLIAHKITDDDYDFLFNQGDYDKQHIKAKRAPTDATVNGTRIKFQNKKCFNGFIHVMEDVVYLLPNMAEYLQTSDKAKIYSRILERFSAPYYFGSASAQDNRPQNDEITKTVNGLVDDGAINIPRQDSVFTKMYLSNHTYGGTDIRFVPSRKSVNKDKSQVLKFDPGWNSYYTPQAGGNTETSTLLQQNMAVMLVPVDSVLSIWWLTGSGKELRARYGLTKYKGRTDLTADEVAEDMDSVDLDVILELVNNNMLTSLTNSVPSKFGNVLNDAQDPMFEQPREAVGTIDSVAMCCNGAIYFTTAVYSPTAYRSVSYPTLVNEKLQIMKWAVKNDDMSFSAYLNSMVSTYSFFCPVVSDTAATNLNGKLIWIDPVSFGVKHYGDNDASKSLTAMVFNYDETQEPKVQGEIYRYDETTGSVTGSRVGAPVTDETIICNRLRDLMDYHIIIGDVERPTYTDAQGYSYFQTKGRGTVRFKNAADFHDMDVQGGWQIETGQKINIIDRIDLSRESVSHGNGRTYLIDKPIMTSRKSVYDILSDSANYPEFNSFFKLMNNAAVNIFQSSNSSGYTIGSTYCVSTFNTYHYTMYIPSSRSVDSLLSTGILCSTDYLDSIDNHYADLKIELEGLYEYNLDSAKIVYIDSMKQFQRRMVDAQRLPGNYQIDTTYDYTVKKFTDYERKKLQNFVKYHIQDNSVYCDAEFNAGYDEHGARATIAKFETAYMDSLDQFAKLTVQGGVGITLKDQNNNVVNVQKCKSSSDAHLPLWNIMCREYEYDVKSLEDESSTASAQLETSSYVVLHLIDRPLCNGEVKF